MENPDPPDDFEETILETFREMHAEAQKTPMALTVPTEVIECIEAYEKRTGVDRDTLLFLAIKAQKGRIDQLVEACCRMMDDPDSFDWPIKDPLLCVAIAFLQKHAYRWADKVHQKYGLDDIEEADPADWWKAAD
jgi:hypothetical protein